MKQAKQGPGRPPISEGEATVPLMVRLPPSMLDQLDKSRGQEPRSGYARRILTQTLQGKNMELSVKERMILINQCRILEKLYPDESKYYKKQRIAFEGGYCLDYIFSSENIHKDEVTVEECKEIYSILDMHRAIYFSFKGLTDKTGLKDDDFKFKGFDGNYEGKQFGYICYIIEDLGKYEELKNLELNSHSPMLDKYRSMLKEWYIMGKSFTLSKDQILKIISMK